MRISSFSFSKRRSCSIEFRLLFWQNSEVLQQKNKRHLRVEVLNVLSHHFDIEFIIHALIAEACGNGLVKRGEEIRSHLCNALLYSHEFSKGNFSFSKIKEDKCHPFRSGKEFEKSIQISFIDQLQLQNSSITKLCAETSSRKLWFAKCGEKSWCVFACFFLARRRVPYFSPSEKSSLDEELLYI